ncbi:hypothetical protein V6N13_104726 [Hibiscus sabdariffa]
MKSAITDYVSRCLTCQKVKVEHLTPTGLLQPLKFPRLKWERITMDFVSGLPITPRKNDSVWVIVDRLAKFARFIPVKVYMSSDILAEIYIREVIRLHGVPISIVSNRDPKFTSRFWKSLQKALELSKNWEKSIPLVEFAYNNSYQTLIQMAPFEALYGRRLKQAFDRQKAYVDTKRRDIRYEVGDNVFLKVSPWKKVLRFGKKGKLSPRYIGPFEVIEKVGLVAY